MTESKTCILFGLSPDPKCLGLCEGLVDETELAVDEEKFRNSIRFTLGGLIAEGCDHILADAGCRIRTGEAIRSVHPKSHYH